ncbi:MAG: molecular chaperone HscC [Clostridiales bacterium]
MSIIGIDLGTTNSLVSCFIENNVVVIKNTFGEKLTPSIVSIISNDEIIVGKTAKERLISHPELTIGSFKRYMGTDKIFQLGNYNFNSIDLSSFVLKSLKEDAELFLNTKIEEAIISVPAYFNDKQRKATKAAATLSGLKVERLINEPTAAALAYGINESNEEKKVLVFDLGGGTFDVSMLDVFGDIMEVKAVAGNNYLGGDDFDEYLVNYFIQKSRLELSEINNKNYAMIRKCAEQCKFNLTKKENFEMNCLLNNKEYKVNINNEIFKKISNSAFEKLKKPLSRLIRDSEISINEIDDIILVGGSTKMPIIRSFVTRNFLRFPKYNINPDEIVAIGAGLCAAMKKRDKNIKEKVLTDVCPFTLGVNIARKNTKGEYSSGKYFPLIERNTTIPKSIVKTLYTINNYQKFVKISIYQGESRLVKDNIKLGKLNISVPPMLAGKASIDVRFTYDINGILEVQIKSNQTGEVKKKVILNNEIDMTEEEINKRLKELDEIKIHPRELSINKYLVSRAERLYEESNLEIREIISSELDKFEEILERQDLDIIPNARNVFESFLNELELWQL